MYARVLELGWQSCPKWKTCGFKILEKFSKKKTYVCFVVIKIDLFWWQIANCGFAIFNNQ